MLLEVTWWIAAVLIPVTLHLLVHARLPKEQEKQETVSRSSASVVSAPSQTDDAPRFAATPGRKRFAATVKAGSSKPVTTALGY